MAHSQATTIWSCYGDRTSFGKHILIRGAVGRVSTLFSALAFASCINGTEEIFQDNEMWYESAHRGFLTRRRLEQYPVGRYGPRYTVGMRVPVHLEGH